MEGHRWSKTWDIIRIMTANFPKTLKGPSLKEPVKTLC